MENSISALAYSGSITNAIAEAKMQKKLFVVYISGDNVDSTHLEESTWMDANVAESISKYCILIHISEGSTDAANFSAIYPQKPAPCITAIGFNGAQLWQSEGFVSAEILASTLEKAWLSLHLQETTATFLTAALASNKSEPRRTNSSNTASFEEGSSSSMGIPSPSADKHSQSLEATGVASSEMENEGSVFADVLEVHDGRLSTSSIERAKEVNNDVKVDHSDAGVGHMAHGTIDEWPAPEQNSNVVDHHSEVTAEASQFIDNKAAAAVQETKVNAIVEDKIDLEVKAYTSQVAADKPAEAVQDIRADTLEDDKIEALESCLSESTDVYLNIRLLDGSSLQQKFSVTSTLRMVKDYVDENQTSAIGSYDLAVPYPRKVFNNQDLNKTLSELGLFGRHALIVVPHHRETSYPKGGSSSRDQTSSTTDLDSSNRSNEGYLAFLRRVLSYVNPFSYLGLGGGVSSSNSARESQSSMWQYSPNPALQNNLRGRPSNAGSSNETPPATARDTSTRRQATSSRFGSNIHTLKRDEDDARFRDRNAFWNGNSTEYGGDNKDGK